MKNDEIIKIEESSQSTFITEHRHCKRCGRVLYLIEDDAGGHFLAFCGDCQKLDYNDYKGIWIPAELDRNKTIGRGHCKKCNAERSFTFIAEFAGLKKWQCPVCGNIQSRGFLGEKMEISKDDWVAKAKDLYGDDTEEWMFKCPMCGREQSGKTIREQMKNKIESKRYGLLKKGDEISPECTCYGSDCNYAANGLFTTGILVIMDPDKPHDTNLKRNCLYVFPFSKLDLSKEDK